VRLLASFSFPSSGFLGKETSLCGFEEGNDGLFVLSKSTPLISASALEKRKRLFLPRGGGRSLDLFSFFRDSPLSSACIEIGEVEHPLRSSERNSFFHPSLSTSRGPCKPAFFGGDRAASLPSPSFFSVLISS